MDSYLLPLKQKASVYPEEKYHPYKTPFFSTAEKRIQLLQPATPYSPVFSELSIESSEEPFKCGAEIPITINYYIVGETAENYSTDILYMVLSKGAIVHHGHETVEVEESTGVRKGKVSFNLSVHVELAPVVQVVVYSVLPSENIISASKNFEIEKCFRNKVSLQFSPSKAVPGEKNNLDVSAHPGSLCGLSAIDQSVFLLESGNRLNADKDPVVNKGLLCLKSSIHNLTNTYTTVLLAYTFSLSGEKEIREQLLKDLDNVAIVESALDESDSLSVEISSYVLLAVLTTGQLTTADLGYANRIVSWLVKQQNPYGGFSSSQDTVFSSEGSSTITVKSAPGHSYTFDMNQNKKLLYQERSLQDVPGKYSIDVKRSICVSVQTSLFYNVPTPTEISSLNITVNTEGNCTKSFDHTLTIKFSVQ
ncbi:hypothetical protein KOW79_014804 [Hemibagrus wyckioides]|uniref:Alpha-2-macroglobulin bait region domain-containing protein n=1 Tax=Hemibagrus wyckioides TaxID=337641 RepID=A0A9D3NFV7_9TELE|nr:hypothetical protein KOW79_014804 [Hemibagrus wyckioides]